MLDGLPMILPVGTQVVSRGEVRASHGRAIHPKGAVGVIVSSPGDAFHAYRVRFADGYESSMKREDFALLKELQEGALGGPRGVEQTAGESVLMEHVILKVVIGSRAYGLEGEGSDTDWRGVYLPPAEMEWSLWGVPGQIERDATQEVYWELEKFLGLALKANPNVLEVLYSPLVEKETEWGAELRGLRGKFLSKLVYQTYNGYILSQFRKLGQDLRTKGAVKWKHVMHLIRLQLAGIHVLREGVVPVRVEEGMRERLLAIRRGEMTFEEADAWRQRLHGEMDAAYAGTLLPEQPDYAEVNGFLVRARRGMVK